MDFRVGKCTTSTLGTHKIQGLTLKTVFSCIYSQKNLSTAQPTGMSALGKKKNWPFLLFFFYSFNKQKIEHQPESNFMISWTSNPWKASFPSTLNPVPGSVCLEKSSMLFLSASWQKAACINLETQQVSKKHHTGLS
jgi:hypothetical protein